jgi:hypothetical protein
MIFVDWDQVAKSRRAGILANNDYGIFFLG